MKRAHMVYPDVSVAMDAYHALKDLPTDLPHECQEVEIDFCACVVFITASDRLLAELPRARGRLTVQTTSW